MPKGQRGSGATGRSGGPRGSGGATGRGGASPGGRGRASSGGRGFTGGGPSAGGPSGGGSSGGRAGAARGRGGASGGSFGGGSGSGTRSRSGSSSTGSFDGRSGQTGGLPGGFGASRMGGGPRSTRSGRPRSGGFGSPGPDPIRREERGLGGDLVEGRQAVRELLLAGRRKVRDVWMAEGTDDSPILAEIEQLATEARVAIRRVSKDQLLGAARTETPQGVLAHAEPLVEVDYDDLLSGAAGRPPFLLAVDNVTDPQNLGALLRSADGAGVTGVVLPKHRTVHVTPTVTKAAAGAIERVPMTLVGGLPAALMHAKDRYGAWVVGLDADGPRTVYDLASLASEPLIVVIGAEGTGLSRLVRARCDEIAQIPLRGSLSSLNASVAGAIAMFEMGRHRS